MGPVDYLTIMPMILIGVLITMSPAVFFVMAVFKIKMYGKVPNLKLVAFTFVGVLIAWSPILYLGKQ